MKACLKNLENLDLDLSVSDKVLVAHSVDLNGDRPDINMTHCNDIQIKVEPISPAETPGPYEIPNNMDTCQGAASLQCLGTPPVVMPAGIKAEGEDIHGTSAGTRKALKHKIQSGRRARGQEELTVKFEPMAKRELTEVEIKKRERRKEQNRRAAQKCRIKKRELQSVAMQQYNSLIQQNGNLKNETILLKSEVTRLKCLLKEHEDSGQCKLASLPSNHSVYNKPVNTAAPLNHTPSQPKASNPETLKTLEELKRQASIEKIVKDLERITPHLAATEMALSSLPDTDDISIPLDDDIAEFLQSYSQIGDQDNCSPYIMDTGDVEFKDATADNLPQEEEGLLYWGPDLGTYIPAPEKRQCAVRNLNEEFARCANQDINETIAPAPATVPFCGQHYHLHPHHQQQATISLNNGSDSALPTPLNLEQLSNGDLPHTNPGFVGRFLISNQLSPISPYSSCTSPPSNMTSPSLFQSPAEFHRCSPDTASFSQVPSVFRFPPDARFSPSS